jgi:uncharacterized membrane protein YdjX (TVP38/TMEM64 family)
MKTLLFIVLKVLEVAAWIAIIFGVEMLTDSLGLYDWIDKLPTWAIVILFILCVLIVIFWFVSIFKDWIALNRKWVNKILK